MHPSIHLVFILPVFFLARAAAKQQRQRNHRSRHRARSSMQTFTFQLSLEAAAYITLTHAPRLLRWTRLVRASTDCGPRVTWPIHRIHPSVAKQCKTLLAYIPRTKACAGSSQSPSFYCRGSKWFAFSWFVHSFTIVFCTPKCSFSCFAWPDAC